jgi:hypothetical protein
LKHLDLRREIIKYVQEEISRTGSIPTRYKICKKFGLSWRRLYRVIFGSGDIKGRDGRDLFEAMGIQLLPPASINAVIRSMQKRMRPQILRRDDNKCAVCGSTVKLELAHIYPCPILGESRYPYFSKADVEKMASPYFAPENLIILCRHCHMLFDIKDLTRTFLCHTDRKRAMEMATIVLIDAGIKPSELEEGGVEKVQRGVRKHMHTLYGKHYFEKLCQSLHISKRSGFKRRHLLMRLGKPENLIVEPPQEKAP